MADYYCENCEFFEDRSTDKLIDGYCKKHNQSLNFYDWWEKCDKCVIETLQAENAALRERLGKWAVDNEIVMEPRVKDGKIYYVISRKERRIVTHYICTELTPEAAEARLKELQGGKQ